MKESKTGKGIKAKQMTRAVIKTVAGMALTSPKQFIKLAAHAGDQLLKGEFSQTLHDTYAFFLNNSEIDPKYFESQRFADLAPEFGRVEREAYGVGKLNVLRRIFVNLAKSQDPDGYKKYLLDIALDMTEPEIKVLIADAKLAETVKVGETYPELRSAHTWINKITELSGLRHGSLVVTAEMGLITKGLLSERLLPDRSGTNFVIGHARLSSAGEELYQLMLLENDPVSAE